MLIAIEEARRIVLEQVRPLGHDPVELTAAAGRVLAEAVTSPIDVPPFDSSAVDGFALVAGPPPGWRSWASREPAIPGTTG